MKRIFGYDIICYDDSIEFAMELCQEKNDSWEIEEIDFFIEEDEKITYKEYNKEKK